MDGSSVIFIVMPTVIPLVLFASIAVPYIADRGQIPDDSIHGTYDQSQGVLRELAALGIDYHNVVQVLEDQGVSAFEASWDQLGQRLATALHPGPDVACSDITARMTGVEARRHGRI